LRLAALLRVVLVNLLERFIEEGARPVRDDPLLEAFQGAVIRHALEQAITDEPLDDQIGAQLGFPLTQR
jgi:hypothetical protein